MKFETILALTDLSDESVHGLKLAQCFARRFHSRVFIGYVYVQAKLFERLGTQEPENARRLAEWHRSDDLRQLRELARQHIEPLRLAGLEVVDDASARHGILTLVGRTHPRLICMATRGLTGVKHLLLGSTAEHTMRTAGIPVMVSKGGECPPPSKPLRVLLGLDLGPDPKPLVERVAGFLGPDDELMLGHAVEAAYVAVSPYAAVGAGAGGLDVNRVIAAARAEIETSIPRGAQPNISVHVAGDRPGPGMVELESRLKPDLVVVQTHARKGVGRLVLGSVSEYLARHCAGPVLVLPPA